MSQNNHVSWNQHQHIYALALFGIIPDTCLLIKFPLVSTKDRDFNLKWIDIKARGSAKLM